MATYKQRSPNRRHIPLQQPRLARAIRWLSRIPNGPTFTIPTHTWSQQERDRFIVKNHLVHIFYPEHDLEINRGILVRELPSFLRGGKDYPRERRLKEEHNDHQKSH